MIIIESTISVIKKCLLDVCIIITHRGTPADLSKSQRVLPGAPQATATRREGTLCDGCLQENIHFDVPSLGLWVTNTSSLFRMPLCVKHSSLFRLALSLPLQNKYVSPARRHDNTQRSKGAASTQRVQHPKAATVNISVNFVNLIFV